jgi:hypothetical protein
MAGAVLLVAGGTARAATTFSPLSDPNDPSYGFVGAGQGAGNGQFPAYAGPGGLAVDDATGDLLAIDGSDSRVEVFAPTGSSATYLTQFAVPAPIALAVDQATRRVYVASGDGTIHAFVPDVANPPAYVEDATFTSPASGPGLGELGTLSALAVDPSNGNLLVGTNQAVERFTAAGLFVSAFDGTGSTGGPFSSGNPVGIGVTSAGAVYTLVNESTSSSRVDHFDAAGNWVAQVAAAADQRYQSLAVDRPTNEVLVAGNQLAPGASQGLVPPMLEVFADDVLIEQTSFPTADINRFPPPSPYGVPGLATDGASAGPLYATVASGNAPASGIRVFSGATVPGLTQGPVTAVTTTSLHVSATVQPTGGDTSVHFEASPDGVTWSNATADADVGDGSGAPANPPSVVVSATITGLQPNLGYFIRAVATNALGNTSSTAGPNQPRVTTLAAGPGIAHESASQRTSTSARLSAQINPFGLVTTYHFDYGTSPAYGQQAPPADVPVGKGTTARTVGTTLAALQPSTTYHYRLVGQNAAGTTHGPDATFTTLAADPAARTFELASPADKGGAIVDRLSGAQAAPTGSGIVWGSRSALPSAGGSTTLGSYLSQRTPDGWTLRALDPPVDSPAGTRVAARATLAVSDDLSHSLVTTRRALAAGAVEGGSNLYLEDNATGRYRTVFASPSSAPIQDWENSFFPFPSANPFVDGSATFDHLVVSSADVSFVDGEGAGQLYDATGSGLRNLNPEGGTYSGASTQLGTREQMTGDGSAVLFTDPTGALFLGQAGHDATPLSVSQIPGDVTTPQPVGPDFRLTKDGAAVYFSSASALTTDAVATGAPLLYRYGRSDGRLTLLGSVAQVLGISDGSAYFVSGDVLAAGGVQFSANVYAWRGGTTRFVGALSNSGEPVDPQVSPNGRYLAFSSYDSLTGYASQGAVEVYAYDADAGQLSCASCPQAGAAAGSAALPGFDPIARQNIGFHQPRYVLDDGTVLFDTPERLSALDTNGSRDVYAYRDGEAQLLSAGDDHYDATLQDASADGSDVYFVTTQALVPIDTDGSPDMYDARVGPGMASQLHPPGGTPPCSAEGCRPPAAGGASAAPPAQTTLAGSSGDDVPVVASSKSKVTSLSVRAGVVRLTLVAPKAGRIRLSGAGVRTTARAVLHPGTFHLTVHLTATTRAATRHHARKLSFRISFVPASGAATVVRLTRSVKG